MKFIIYSQSLCLTHILTQLARCANAHTGVSMTTRRAIRRRISAIPLLGLVVLVLASLACGGGKATSEPQDAPAPTQPSAEPSPTPPSTEGVAQESQAEYDTVFPLPDNVQNFTGGGGENMINFQTDLSLEEVVEFYRQTLTELRLTERPVLTVIEDEGFSMVFDGWANGKGLVIQGVDLGETTNVNIRFEDV